MATITVARPEGPELTASAEAWILAIWTRLTPPQQDAVLERVAKIDREGVWTGTPEDADFASPLAAQRRHGKP